GMGFADSINLAAEGWGGARAPTTWGFSVSPHTPTATALYERHGFTDTGEPGDLLPDGVGRERVMAKSLAAV
ncbi:GNAT family N-acetyltransferase, partial [Streptomyces mirabilis]